MDKVLRERESQRGVGPNEFSVLKEVRATVWGSAYYLGPVIEPVFLEGDQLLQE